MFDASLKIGMSDIPPLNAMEEEYISRVRHVQRRSSLDGRNEWIVEAKSIKSNLFHGLNSSWKMTQIHGDDLKDNCSYSLPHPTKDETKKNGGVDTILYTKVQFEVEMSVIDPLISTALDQVLESVALQQMEAFEKRCKLVPEKHG
jgi:ribosome-associated toxin RatA of RatAB toxin-antitoxin module